jgi:hypothetical protein
MPLLIHWQALYIYCHSDGMYKLDKVNSNYYFNYKLMIFQMKIPVYYSLITFINRWLRQCGKLFKSVLKVQYFRRRG